MSSFYPDMDPGALHEKPKCCLQVLPKPKHSRKDEGRKERQDNPASQAKVLMTYILSVSQRESKSQDKWVRDHRGRVFTARRMLPFTTAFLFMTTLRLILFLQIIMAGCPAFNLGLVALCISAGALYFVVSN